jgi:prepilin-type N-terminal cleavage/methylation domain-containing protein
MIDINSKNSKGFTLVEILISILVISIGVVGAYIAIQRGIGAIDFSYSRLEAANLAQEGVEIVKNIRDTNLLERRTATTTPWSEGLADGNYEVQYSDSSQEDPSLSPCPGICDYNNLHFLKKTDGGFYNYNSGTPTKFKRKVYLEKVGDDKIKIYVTVYWKRAGNIYSVLLRDDIYNWQY